jgi:predicted ABC-type ATPase
MSKRRLRVFAGPNGSGKCSMIETIAEHISIENYINADIIEYQLKSDIELKLEENVPN